MKNAGFRRIEQYDEVESLNYFRDQLQKGKKEEEILEILAERSRDNARTPMQWNSEPAAGFTTGKPWIDMASGAAEITVEKQEEDEDSILHFYRKLIRIRKSQPALYQGSVRFLELDPECICYVRTWQDEEILVLCSLTDRRKSICLPESFRNGKVLLANYRNFHLKEDPVILKPYEAVAVRIENTGQELTEDRK